METSAARLNFITRAHDRSLVHRDDRPSSRSEQKAVINAPINEVIATFMSTVGKNGPPSCADTGTGDPTYRCTDTVLGRRLAVRYTFYAIPGGTQVVAAVEHPSSALVHPRLDRAMRRRRRRVADDLASVKDHLE